MASLEPVGNKGFSAVMKGQSARFTLAS